MNLIVHLNKIPGGFVCTLRFWKYCARRGVARPSDQLIYSRPEYVGRLLGKVQWVAHCSNPRLSQVVGCVGGKWGYGTRIRPVLGSRMTCHLTSRVIRPVAGHAVGPQ